VPPLLAFEAIHSALASRSLLRAFDKRDAAKASRVINEPSVQKCTPKHESSQEHRTASEAPDTPTWSRMLRACVWRTSSPTLRRFERGVTRFGLVGLSWGSGGTQAAGSVLILSTLPSRVD